MDKRVEKTQNTIKEAFMELRTKSQWKRLQ